MKTPGIEDMCSSVKYTNKVVQVINNVYYLHNIPMNGKITFFGKSVKSGCGTPSAEIFDGCRSASPTLEDSLHVQVVLRSATEP